MSLRNQQDDWAVRHNGGCGPTFGAGADLRLSNNCNANNRSNHRIGPGAFDNTFLTGGGNYYFTVQEYEVWRVG